MSIFGPKQPIGSTQDALKFAQIRDGVVILKDGNLRQIVLCTSVNFSLKSEQEQNAIIFAYQNFLNSLTFPVQIVMQSKKLDLTNYLKMLDEKAQDQTNELLRTQTLDYVDFIKRLINIANIMDKRFYIVIPYMIPPKMNNSGQKQIIITQTEFAKYKVELDQRAQVVQSGLANVGVRTALLNTQQLIELMYSIYNPEESSKQKIADADILQGEVVQSVVSKPKEKKEPNE
jgi:type IV secretory pathway VirB4 component